MSKPLAQRFFSFVVAAAALAAGCVGTEPTVPSFALCAPPFVQCGDACVDTNLDALHCGACDNACNVQQGEACGGGACTLTCPGATTACSGSCIDTQTDAAHCGNCATACDATAGEVCTNGSCGVACGGGTTNCNGECVNTANDPAHCGDCTLACSGGQVCSGGSCGLTCTGGTTLCDERCVDFESDPLHCGNCKTACATDAGETCVGGACASACAGGTTRCGSACIDTDIDAAHCGACDVSCGQNAVCDAGRCACASGYEGDGQTCADVDECAGDNDCSPSGECVNTVGGYACRCRDGQTGDGKMCTGLELVTVTAPSVSNVASTGALSGLAVSADARYVAFVSNGSDLTASSFGMPSSQAYVRDMIARTTTLASVNDTGAVADSDVTTSLALSADGSHVAFVTNADNLGGGNPDAFNVFVRDLPNATTIVRSGLATSGPVTDSDEPALSRDGGVVAFETGIELTKTKLHGDVVYMSTSPTKPFAVVSASDAGAPPGDPGCSSDARPDAELPSVSGDGKRIVFDTAGVGLTADPDSNCASDVFLRDFSNSAKPVTTLLSANVHGEACSSQPGEAGSRDAVLSADGNFVAFDSTCSDLSTTEDQLSAQDVFVRDLTKGTVTRVSVTMNGAEANDDSFGPQISADGRYVAFVSYATNLVAGAADTPPHVYVRDLLDQKTIRVDPHPSAGEDDTSGVDTFALASNGGAIAFITSHHLLPQHTFDGPELYLLYLR